MEHPALKPSTSLRPGGSASATTEQDITVAQGRTLLAVAREAIEWELSRGMERAVAAEDYEPALREKRATFVTLHLGRGSDAPLRGCIGTLEAHRPLVEDVAHNACAAAFRDPRFPPLAWGQWPHVHLHISVLSVPAPLTFTSEDDLLAQLRPGIDGLILEETKWIGRRRGTFLPAVWETLPDRQTFWTHLKTKAGLPTDHWSTTLRVWRYTAQSISDL